MNKKEVMSKLNELQWLEVMIDALKMSEKMATEIGDNSETEGIKAGFWGMAGGYRAAREHIEERLNVVKSKSD